jgi:hypothetical protein
LTTSGDATGTTRTSESATWCAIIGINMTFDTSMFCEYSCGWWVGIRTGSKISVSERTLAEELRMSSQEMSSGASIYIPERQGHVHSSLIRACLHCTVLKHATSYAADFIPAKSATRPVIVRPNNEPRGAYCSALLRSLLSARQSAYVVQLQHVVKAVKRTPHEH